MTVKIDWEQSYVNEEDGRALVSLSNPEKDSKYGSFVAFSSRDDVEEFNDGSEAIAWDWENPGCGLKDVTFSPSLILNWDEQEFHIYIREGEVVHCQNCNCGCKHN